MTLTRHGAEDTPDVGRNILAKLPFGDNFVDLCRGRHVPGEQEVPERFHGGILGTLDLGERREDLRDGLAAEADAFLGIEVGDVGNQGGNTTGTADHLVDCHLVDHHSAEMPDQHCDMGTELLYLLGKYILKSHLCSFSLGDGISHALSLPA